MKPAAFDYVRAESRHQVLELLAEYGADARIIAGGQSLMAVLNMRLAQPKLLIDINQVADLAYIELRQDCLAVGAAVRQALTLVDGVQGDATVLRGIARSAGSLNELTRAATEFFARPSRYHRHD